MIHVTDNAVNHLRSLLAEQPAPGGKGLRVQVAKGGCSGLQYEMSLDERHEGDAVVERDEVQFLIDAESADFLRDATLDFEDGLTGAGFRIVNPERGADLRLRDLVRTGSPGLTRAIADDGWRPWHGTGPFSLR